MMEFPIFSSKPSAILKSTTAALLLSAITLPTMASAQALGAPTREELQRQEVERTLRDDASNLSIESQIERAPCPLAAPQFADLRFTLKGARFEGLGDISPATVASAWRPFEGKEIAVASICEIRDRAATILRSRGYLAAVQIPPQTIETGELRFDVVFARIRSVQVRGDAGNSTAMLERYLAKLEGQSVFNTNDAERYLLLARDIPGLDVRLTLQPLPAEQGGQPGDVVGVFDVSNTPAIIDANIQNFGSRAVGQFGGLARLRVHGLTGLGDETMLSAFSAQDFDEQAVVQGSHEFRIGSEGLTLGLAGTYAWTQPDLPGADVFESETFVGSAYARYPLVRSQEMNVMLTAGADFIDQEVEFSGLDFSSDNLRVAYARAEINGLDRNSIAGRSGYSAIEPKMGYAASLEVRQGFDIFGASPDCGPAFANCLLPGVTAPSRLDADPTGFLLRGQTQVDYRITPLLGLRAISRFQYTPDKLLSYEQFSGGNYTVGRGYDPGAIIGDNGIGTQFEVFYGSLVPKTPDTAAVQPFAFFDLAAVSSNSLSNDWDRIISAGGGLRMSIGRQASFDLFGAIPLERPNLATRKGDARLLMSLTVQLMPWFN